MTLQKLVLCLMALTLNSATLTFTMQFAPQSKRQIHSRMTFIKAIIEEILSLLSSKVMQEELLIST